MYPMFIWVSTTNYSLQIGSFVHILYIYKLKNDESSNCNIAQYENNISNDTDKSRSNPL